MDGVCLDDGVSDTTNVVAALGLESRIYVGREEVGKAFVDDRIDDAVDHGRELDRDVGDALRHRRGEEVAFGLVEAAVQV